MRDVLQAISACIPTCDPVLSPSIYEMVLYDFLQSDYAVSALAPCPSVYLAVWLPASLTVCLPLSLSSPLPLSLCYTLGPICSCCVCTVSTHTLIVLLSVLKDLFYYFTEPPAPGFPLCCAVLQSGCCDIVVVCAAV